MISVSLLLEKNIFYDQYVLLYITHYYDRKQDNWLNVSKNKIQSGEIILVHGNLNEHRGIRLFFDQNQSGKHYVPIEDIFAR